jgi:hypothetical protein
MKLFSGLPSRSSLSLSSCPCSSRRILPPKKKGALCSAPLISSFSISKSRIQLHQGKWDTPAQNLFPLDRSTCRAFPDSSLLTVVRTRHIGSRKANQQASLRKDFCQPVPALRGSAAPPYASSSPADEPFHSACSPVARSSRSACPQTCRVAQTVRHVMYENHRVLKGPRMIRSHSGPEKLPSRQRRQSPHFH